MVKTENVKLVKRNKVSQYKKKNHRLFIFLSVLFCFFYSCDVSFYINKKRAEFDYDSLSVRLRTIEGFYLFLFLFILIGVGIEMREL